VKLKDIGHWSERWSTPLGTMDANAPVGNGVIVDLSLWGTTIIGLAVQCPDGSYFGSIRVQRDVYDRVLDFLRRNHGRKIRELMDAEIDISDGDAIGPMLEAREKTWFEVTSCQSKLQATTPC
jgi:hypothetical protein